MQQACPKKQRKEKKHARWTPNESVTRGHKHPLAQQSSTWCQAMKARWHAKMHLYSLDMPKDRKQLHCLNGVVDFDCPCFQNVLSSELWAVPSILHHLGLRAATFFAIADALLTCAWCLQPFNLPTTKWLSTCANQAILFSKASKAVRSS